MLLVIVPQFNNSRGTNKQKKMGWRANSEFTDKLKYNKIDISISHIVGLLCNTI